MHCKTLAWALRAFSEGVANTSFMAQTPITAERKAPQPQGQGRTRNPATGVDCLGGCVGMWEGHLRALLRCGAVRGEVQQGTAFGVRPVGVGDAVPLGIWSQFFDCHCAVGASFDGYAVSLFRGGAASTPIADSRLPDAQESGQPTCAPSVINREIKSIHAQIITQVIEIVNTKVIHCRDEITPWKQ